MSSTPRRHKRLTKRMPIRFGPEAPKHLGFTKDISIGGMAVASAVHYPIDTLLYLEMTGEKKPIEMRGFVRWVSVPDRLEALSGLKSTMGIELVQRPEGFVNIVLEEFDRHHENRKQFRFSKSFKVIFENPKDLLDTYTQDISQGGLFILSPDSPALDTMVQLKLVISDTMDIINVEGQVVHVITAEMAESHGLNAGFGVEFTNFIKDDDEKLKKYIAGLIKRSGYQKQKG